MGTVGLRRTAYVVAIDPTANRDRAVAIETGEVEPKSIFLNACTKNIAEPAIEGIETLAAPKGVE
jgi:hypothetical protein